MQSEMGSRATTLCNNCLIGFTLLTLLHSLAVNVLSSSVTVTIAKSDYGYGVPCEEDYTCQNFSVLLACSPDSQVCGCVKKSAVFLDESLFQCQVIAGKSCYRQNPNQYDDYYYEREYITVPCVSHAICQVVNSLNPNNKVCQCTSEYYANETGLCVPRRDYGESCEYIPSASSSEMSEVGSNALTSVTGTADQCDVNRYFECSPEGVCGCQSGLEYNVKQNTCYVPVGQNCRRNDPSTRSNAMIFGKHDVCPIFSECFKGICQCIPGFVPSSDNSCHHSWGQSCNATRVCSDYQFVCRNGTCQCKYPLHQIYDKHSRECLSLVPGPCTMNVTAGNDDRSTSSYSGPGGPTIKCVPNAECVETQNSETGQCRCESRYKQDKFGHCVKPFGHDCNFDHECQVFKTELVCVNGTCGCPDLLQAYDREREVCLGLVGSRCQMVMVELLKYKSILADQADEDGGGGGGRNGDWNGPLKPEPDNELEGENYTYNNGNGNGDENGNGNSNSKRDYADAGMKSWCVDGAECRPFGSLAQFGQIGECACLDDWEPAENGRCAKLFE